MNEQLTRYLLVPLAVEAELGRRTLTVREILSLSPGSVVTLNSPVGSKVTIAVGGASFCTGDIMRRGKSAAIRITSFFDPQARS